MKSVVLRDTRDADGVRYLAVHRKEDGGIVIEGQDLGIGVERTFGKGLTEYEWSWSISPDAVPALVAALGGVEDEDPLQLLTDWFEVHGKTDPGIHLRDAGVPVAFWSRVGD